MGTREFARRASEEHQREWKPPAEREEKTPGKSPVRKTGKTRLANFQLDEGHLEALADRAKKQRTTMTGIMAELLADYLGETCPECGR